MRRLSLWILAGLAAALAGLGVRRTVGDARASRVEADLAGAATERFSDAHLDGLPEPARRYLHHAIARGTPLVPSCRLEMTGEIAPAPGAPRAPLAAVETIAPRRGFVWTAEARVKGLPVRVRDHYHEREGGVRVDALGLIPITSASGADVARSSRGRLVGEAVWCPTALVHPDIVWEAAGPDRARYTVAVDGAPVSVTLLLDADGAVQEVTLDRWGDPDGGPFGLHPYGFRVEAEGTFGGVTIPTRVTGGWGYGTDAYDSAAAARFTIRRATFASP